MKLFKKAIAIILCLLMVFSFSACGDTSWVFKTDKTTIGSGLYMYYLLTWYNNAYSVVEDTSKDVLKQTVEGVNASDWIKTYAEDEARFAIVVMEMFEEEGLTLSDELTSQIKTSVDQTWAYYGSLFTANGINYDTFYKVTTVTAMTDLLFEHLYGKGGAKEISEEAMKEALDENYTKVKEVVISLAAATGDMRSEELQATLKAKAEDYKTRIEAGESIDEIIKEHYKLEMELAAEEYGMTYEELTSSITAEADTDFVIVTEGNTNFSEKEITEVSKLEVGDVIVTVEDEYVRVMQKYDILEDNTYLEAYDYNIRVSLKAEEFIDDLEAKGQALELQVNDAALKKYKPSKIKY